MRDLQPVKLLHPPLAYEGPFVAQVVPELEDQSFSLQLAVNRYVEFTGHAATLELAETEVTQEHWSRR